MKQRRETTVGRNRQRGFTLSELMIVIVVIGILTAIAVPRLRDAKAQAQLAVCKNNLRQIQAALALFSASADRYPASLGEEAFASLLAGDIAKCPTSQVTYSYALRPDGTYAVSCAEHHLLLTEDGLGVLEGGGDPGGGGEDPPAYPLWSPTVDHYNGGDYVLYDGRVFRARYYASRNQVPGELSSPWQEITDAWRFFNVYNGGEIVWYEGKKFKARYWTQNHQPGLMSSPWQELTDEWRSFNVYNAGDVVLYNGRQYRAKWYSQNLPPDTSEAWEMIH